MKIGLVHPNCDSVHKKQRQAYGPLERPPETGLAVLSSWIKEYSVNDHEITVFNPNKSIKELARQASQCDLLGMTNWFANHGYCIEISRLAKQINPELKVVFGGPNASMIPKEIFHNNSHVDYVVNRDGEDALLSIADEKPLSLVPNLWFKDSYNNPRFTFQSYTDLSKMPLWNYSNFEDVEKRFSEYLHVQKTGLDPWLTPPLTLFSFRGCLKAIREGICSYCTSSEATGRMLSAQKFWDQIMHLNNNYDAEIFYMADDIFPVSPIRINTLANAKPHEARAKIRAYAYLPYLSKLADSQLTRMAHDLQKIGVFNLFFGAENYDENILKNINKTGISVEETARIMKLFYKEGGIKSTVAFMLGLPGESKQTMEYNKNVLKRLLESGCFERLYISIAAPFKGSFWCKSLESDKKFLADYETATGKNLQFDDAPDYGLLSRLSIKHKTSTNPEELINYFESMIDMALQYMPEYRVGGFLTDFGVN
ncbi:MAG: cobalamin-dependent protein [Candidatus Diapherotrites archaeon]